MQCNVLVKYPDNALHAGSFFVFLLSFSDFFPINFLQKVLSGTLAECLMVCIKIRTNIIFVLVWFQSVCKGFLSYDKSHH